MITKNFQLMLKAYKERAYIYELMGDYERAVKDLEFYISYLEDQDEINSVYLDITKIYSVGKSDQKKAEEYLKRVNIKKSNNKEIIAKYYNVKGGIFYNKSDYDSAQHCYEYYLNLSIKMKNDENIAKAYGNIGYIYQNKGDYKKAQEYYQKSYEYFDKTGNIRLKTLSLNDLGGIVWFQRDFKKALVYFKQFLNNSKKIGDKRAIGLALGNMGLVYTELGSYKNALNSLEKYLKISQEIRNQRDQASAYCNIGNVYYAENEFNKALEYYKKYYKISKKIGNKKAVGTALSNIGMIWGVKGYLDKTIKYYKKSLKIYEEISYNRGIIYALSNLALAYEYRGELDIAIKMYNKIITISKGKDLFNYGLGNLLLSRIYLKKGSLDKVRNKLIDAQKTFEKLKDEESLYEVYAYYCQLYILSNDIKNVEKYYNMIKEHIEKSPINEINPLILQVKAKYLLFISSSRFEEAYNLLLHAAKNYKKYYTIFDYYYALLEISKIAREYGKNSIAEKFYKKAQSILTIPS